MEELRISACMIVKNEEHCLERCLNSIQGVVDEIIIVDTGSSDNTKEIAQRYTDKIYDSPWIGDFSFHRNESVSYATGDWILIIDADEELNLSTNREKFVDALKNIDKSIGYASIVMEDYQRGQMVMRCNSLRLFRKGMVKYKGRVHNQPITEGKMALFTDVKVFHYGYDLSPERMKAKFERTADLLLQQYENNENPHVEFYLCQLYGQHKYLDECTEWGDRYYKKREELGEDFNQTTYFTLTKNYIELNRMEDAFRVIKDFLATGKHDPDMGLAISDFGAKSNDFDIMMIGCRKYLEDVEHYNQNRDKTGGKFYFSIREDVEQLILYRLCMAHFRYGVDAWRKIKIDKFDDVTSNELKKNLDILGLSFLLEKKEDYKLPMLKAI